MERNETFAAEGLDELNIRLAWAQIELYTDEIDQIQIIASGDEHTLRELRIAVKDKCLEIEQPQYGITLDITHGHWMEICVRVPKAWEHNIHANTISGPVSVKGLSCESISIETISGDLKASRLTAGHLSLRSTAGAIFGKHLLCMKFICRSVSGDIALKDITAKEYRFVSVSGDIAMETEAGFDQMDIRTVSGDCIIDTQLEELQLSVRSMSSRRILENITQTEEKTAPSLRFIGVSGDLKITGKRTA